MRRYFHIICTFIFGILLSLFLFMLVHKWEFHNKRMEFESRSKGYATAVQISLYGHIEALKFLGDFFNSSEIVTRQEFASFTENALSRHPGIQSLSWDPLVTDSERAAYEASAREDGFKNFEFSELSDEKKIIRAAHHPEYVVVYYIAPLEANKSVLGYDITSNPILRREVAKGFATGKLTATDRIALPQESGQQFGIMLFLPLYQRDVAGKSAGSRHKYRKGVVAEVLQIGDAVEGAMKNFADEGINLYLYDLEGVTEKERFLYFSPTGLKDVTKIPLDEKSVKKGLYWTRTFDFIGHKWEILFSPSSAYLHRHYIWQELVVLFISLSLTFTLAFYLWRKLKYTEDIEQRVLRQAQTNQELEDKIVEQKQTEEALRQSEDKYRTLIESANDAIFILDMDGKFLEVNRATYERLGYTKEEILSMSISELDDPQFADMVPERLEQINKDGGGVFESAHVRKDGTVMPVEVNSRIINYKGRKAFLSVIRDITDRKKAAQEKAELEFQLHQAHKLEAVGVLAGGIAHDFNNILAAILGNINLATLDDDLKDGTKKLLKRAEKASLRAKNLTQQLLTFSRGGDPIKEVSSLGTVIIDSADFVLHGDTTVCHFDIPDDLWFVDIDKGQISQVIQNIVLNASHAMPEGGIIKVNCENLASLSREAIPFTEDGRFVKIIIQDSGIGIPPDIVDKIFDPYFSTKHGGSGLGLAITQAIIKKHHGHITVKSSPGVGTTFTLYLPASENTELQEQESVTENRVVSPAKILIMDDEVDVRRVVQQMLVKMGHEVTLATEGVGALRLYQEAMDAGSPYDLVLMDITIPGGMGGKKAMQELRNIDPDVKAVVSSGYSNDPIMANFKEYGFSAAIVKPYRLQELSKVINLIIDGYNKGL
jgi:PAS domain S-box-containing protein